MKHHSQQAHEHLQKLASIWLVDGERVRWLPAGGREASGFDWWPGEYRVSVRAYPSDTTTGPGYTRIAVQTDFLTEADVKNSRFQSVFPSVSVPFTSAYAWTYVPQSILNKGPFSTTISDIWLSNTSYISDTDNGNMLQLLAAVAILQPINAQLHARPAVDWLGTGRANTSLSHQDSGFEFHDILDTVAGLYEPLGRAPSRWLGSDEFENFAEKYARSDNCFGMGDTTGLTLETPFGSDSALIRLQTDETHPQLGSGLLVTLTLPFSDDASEISSWAAALNYFESTWWTGFAQFGAWHTQETESKRGRLVFALFVPNALYKEGLAAQASFWFLARARWARELLFPDMNDTVMSAILEKRFTFKINNRRRLIRSTASQLYDGFNASWPNRVVKY